LMQRGEEAWSLAMIKPTVPTERLVDASNAISCTVTTDGVSGGESTDASKQVAKIITDASKTCLQTVNDQLASTGVNDESEKTSTINTGVSFGEVLTTTTTKAKTATSAATEGLSLPEANEVKQVYQMLKDEDLTILFQKSKERLKQLVEDDVPERTKCALGALGIEVEDNATFSGKKASAREKIDKLRKEALVSLEKILKISRDDNNNLLIQTNHSDGVDASITINTKDIQSTISSALPLSHSPQLLAQQQFAKMFDHLSNVASSDSQLSNIFSSISEKTKLWQEMTGRLLQTKTASLFMEGSQRLRSRAAHLLKITPGQIRGAVGGISGGTGSSADSELTRAFTEGDVAIAKLKSMEMGDAIRQRLFAAIELRSESSGGLDAIIAGSLAAITRTGESIGAKAESLVKNQQFKDLTMASTVKSASAAVSEDAIQNVIANLQQSATSAMKGTKETLIALLSQRSQYRDAVLLRLEQVFLGLESELGRDMTAEEIASLARGEGGSLALFQPVAMRAAKEIENQLDAAEKSLKGSENWNPKVMDAMNKVRQITKGELSMTDILDMAAVFLDDEEVVARGEGLMVRAEEMLDEFESASAKLTDAKKLGDAKGTAAAGIMDAVQKAGITKDEVMKRVESFDVNKLLDSTGNVMTDEAARRELISSAGDTALDFLLRILPSMPVPPFDGVREGLVYHLSNLSMAGFKVKKEDIHIEVAGIRATSRKEGATSQCREVKASELLIIDIKNISATLDDAVWSFEQTYMPYLKGSGKANTKLWDGSIRLKFELRRRLIRSEEDSTMENSPEKWEPILCLNDRTCSIGGIELVIQGESRITWIANKLASYLRNPLREYVTRVIVTALTNNSGWLIDTLNKNLGNYWDLIMRTASLKLEDLPKLSRHHITQAESIDEREIELVWREKVPLGLNILTNDKSGLLKIVDFPRGTQARQVAQSKQLDPDIFKGSTIVGVNGRKYGIDDQPILFAALKDPARPKAIMFRLASQDNLQRLDLSSSKATTKCTNGSKVENENSTSIVKTVDIVDKVEIGIKFAKTQDGYAYAVSGFLRDSSGEVLASEKNGEVKFGDLLSHVNGTLVLRSNGDEKSNVLSLLGEVGGMRPLSLGFVKPYLQSVIIERNVGEEEVIGGPNELLLTEIKTGPNSKENKIVLKDFDQAEGVAEAGGIFIGDNLIFVNGIPVGAGCRLVKSDLHPNLNEVMEMLEQQSPLKLTFARANTSAQTSAKRMLSSSPLSLEVESANKFNVDAPNFEQLGCQFAVGYNGTDIVVKSITGVEGIFQRQLKDVKKSIIGSFIESIDGEVIPSYVTPQIIINAINRRWTTNGQVEITFCNEKHRDAVRNLCNKNATQN